MSNKYNEIVDFDEHELILECINSRISRLKSEIKRLENKHDFGYVPPENAKAINRRVNKIDQLEQIVNNLNEEIL